MLYKLILLAILNGEAQINTSTSLMDESACQQASVQYVTDYFVKCEPVVEPTKASEF